MNNNEIDDLKAYFDESKELRDKLETMFFTQSKLIAELSDFLKNQQARIEIFEREKLAKEKRLKVTNWSVGILLGFLGIYNFAQATGFFQDFAARVISERRIQFAFTNQLINQIQALEQANLFENKLRLLKENKFVDSVKNLKVLKIGPNLDLDTVKQKLIDGHRIDTARWIYFNSVNIGNSF
jgi:hypothetical protein